MLSLASIIREESTSWIIRTLWIKNAGHDGKSSSIQEHCPVCSFFFRAFIPSSPLNPRGSSLLGLLAFSLSLFPRARALLHWVSSSSFITFSWLFLSPRVISHLESLLLHVDRSSIIVNCLANLINVTRLTHQWPIKSFQTRRRKFFNCSSNSFRLHDFTMSLKLNCFQLDVPKVSLWLFWSIRQEL